MVPVDLSTPPGSTLLTMGIAFLISIITALLNRKFIDKEKHAKWKEEIDRWNADKKLLKKTGDKKLAAKVKKQELHVLQMQSKMMSQQTKTTFVTLIPLLIMWPTLMGFFGPNPVAYVPLMPGDPPYALPFVIWYFVCNFFASTVVSRILGVQMMGMGQK
jgi:uncharacterized membrane protein (DUF106 family)